MTRTATTTTAPKPPARGLAVSSGKLYYNGQRWVPRGFNSVAALYPAGGVYAHARTQFETGNTLTAMKAWNVNAIRLQVVQKQLADPAQATAYIAGIRTLVTQARGAGLVVVLAMQDSLPSPWGEQPNPNSAVPTAKTDAAWMKLAPAFAGNPGVAYELYNELGVLDTTYTTWGTWRRYYQNLVDLVHGRKDVQANMADTGAVKRADGKYYLPNLPALASNVLLVGGLHKAMTYHLLGSSSLLRGANLVYACHPYNFASPGTPAAWHDKWQYLIPKAPVWHTEWHNQDAQLQINGTVATFLAYCKTNSTGLLGWPFDHTGDQVLVTIGAVNPKDYAAHWTFVPRSPSGAALQAHFKSYAVN